MLAELDEYGLRILDEEKFEKHVKASVRSDMIYKAIFIGLVIFIIIKWIIRLTT